MIGSMYILHSYTSYVYIHLAYTWSWVNSNRYLYAFFMQTLVKEPLSFSITHVLPPIEILCINENQETYITRYTYRP